MKIKLPVGGCLIKLLGWKSKLTVKESVKLATKWFLDFKKRNKVVHKDVIFKGGFIDFKNGWKYTDSLIIIKRSKNEKKHKSNIMLDYPIVKC